VIGFALQNFFRYQPFLIKTVRYRTAIKYSSSDILTFFIKITTSYGLFSYRFTYVNGFNKLFFDTQFTKKFWYTFKKLYFKKMGIYTNSLTMSYMHWSIDLLYKSIDSHYAITVPNRISYLYARPVEIVHFSLHKRVFDPFILYIIMLVTGSYLAKLNFFQLKHGFVFVKYDLNVYMSLNCFYFKVRRY